MRNYKKYIFVLLAINILSLFAFFLSACDEYIKSNKYTVMLPDGVGYTVSGLPIVEVEPNGTVVFDVGINDGYEFVYSSLGEYSDGKLVIEKVKYSATVNFIARLSEEIASVENGTISVSACDGGAAIYGEKAEFLIVPKDNYVVDSVVFNGEEFEFERESNGSVIVTAQYDEYVSVKAVCLGRECEVMLADTEFGAIKAVYDGAIPRYDDTVHLEFTADENYKIVYFDLGGDRIYGCNSYEFIIGDDTYVSARFVGDDFPVLIYDYNGGEYAPDTNIIDIAKAGDFVYIKNGLNEWMREGYTLESWNTKPDGSGERHALGAMIAMPSEDTVYYAQYKKHTDLEYFGFGECVNHSGEAGYKITSFNSASDIGEVVLPDTYNGKKVYAVADGVFRGAATVRSIVTNAYIEEIGDSAFAEMPNLEELYLYDSLRSLSKTALDNSPLNKLHINSAGRRIYERILETNIVDKQMLVKTSTRQKIVTLSGCSLAKGMKSELFNEDNNFKDYDVIHMGVHARYGLGMLMAMVEEYINPGDIVVLALENYQHLWLTDKGMKLVNSESAGRLKHLESNYDIYEEFNLKDTKEINDILTVLPNYFAERAKDLDRNYTATASPSRYDMNEHGDYTYFRPSAGESSLEEEAKGYIDTQYPSMSFFDGLDRINAWAQKQIDRGVRVCFIFPPVYRYKAYDDEKNKALRDAFETKLNAEAVFPVLGSIDDAALPYWCLSDWINHPSTEGTSVYTERFVKLLSGAVSNGVI